ncbi:hypothetical protein ACLOJK_037304 [Asimina triloba]
MVSAGKAEGWTDGAVDGGGEQPCFSSRYHRPILKGLGQTVVTMLLPGSDRATGRSPELPSPAAMAVGLEEGDGAPYECSGGAP